MLLGSSVISHWVSASPLTTAAPSTGGVELNNRSPLVCRDFGDMLRRGLRALLLSILVGVPIIAIRTEDIQTKDNTLQRTHLSPTKEYTMSQFQAHLSFSSHIPLLRSVPFGVDPPDAAVRGTYIDRRSRSGKVVFRVN